jgi:hypothetical protein
MKRILGILAAIALIVAMLVPIGQAQKRAEAQTAPGTNLGVTTSLLCATVTTEYRNAPWCFNPQNGILYVWNGSNAYNSFTGGLTGAVISPALALGTPGSVAGTLTFAAVTGSGTFTLAQANSTTTYTLTAPNTAPSVSGQVLSATTGGVGSWATMEAYPLHVSGSLGGLTSTAAATLLQEATTVTRAGHAVDLTCTTDLNGGACTTAPSFNVRDVTGSTTGTVACGNVAGAVKQAESLAFAAGDQIAIVRTVNGGTCTAPQFVVSLHASFP